MLRYKDAYHTAQLTCAVNFILKKEGIFILTQHDRLVKWAHLKNQEHQK